MKTTHLTLPAKRPPLPGFMVRDFPDDEEVGGELSSEGEVDLVMW